MSDKFIEVEHLRQYFPAGGHGKNKKYIQAVDDVSFSINRGETLGLVGESGCGKTTLGKLVLNLETADEGDVFYKDTLISDLNLKKMKPYRKYMQMIFQCMTEYTSS